MISSSLPGPWTLSFPVPDTDTVRTLEVPVPGNIARALEQEGLVENATPSDRVDALREFELIDDWTYRTEFDAPDANPGDTIFLLFDGIDTLADIRLNGEPLLRCENMLIAHEVEVTGRLRPAGNLLEVVIRSLERFARSFSYDSFQISRGNHAERQAQAYLRTARHLWGWDNAPRLLTGGIWRPVRLEVRPPIRFTEVYLYTQRIHDADVWIGCNWSFISPDTDLRQYRAMLRLSSPQAGNHELPIEVEFVSGRNIWRLNRETVALWWPRGFGAPHLYEVELMLYRGDEELTVWRGRWGIRHIELRMSETVTAEGDGEFVFICNNEPIYINGTNWKPLDAHHAEAPARMDRALALAEDLHCNMIRIWGGGIYEDHDFFDWCDAHGMLVWQDFMFACEFPPRDRFFQEAVAKEAAFIVKRLRNHPSLALWCGDNEIDSMWFWDTLIPSGLKPSDNVITREVLREAVLRYDPYRGYVASSPYVADEVAALRWVHPKKRAIWSPEDHLYPRDPHYRKAYRESPSLFLGETGPFFMNAISESPELLEEWKKRVAPIWDTPMPLEKYTVDRHQTLPHILCWKDCALHRLAHFFDRKFDYRDPSDFVFGLNILCGDIFKYAIEFSRSRKWRKTGILWWSLVDMWPMAFNYSVVDYLWRKKKPYYWIKQSQQPLCVMAVEPDDDANPELFVANDTGQAESGHFRITAWRADGSEQVLLEDRFAAPRNRTTPLGPLAFDPAPAMWLIEWDAGQGPCYNHYFSGRSPVDFTLYRSWIERLDAIYEVE